MYPLTGISKSLALLIIGYILSRLYLMLQFMFFWEKDSEAEMKTAISLAWDFRNCSKPCWLGTRAEYLVSLAGWGRELITCRVFAICGTHFGETKLPHSMFLRLQETSCFIMSTLWSKDNCLDSY